MHSSVNVLDTTEMYTEKWLTLGNFMYSIFYRDKNFGKNGEIKTFSDRHKLRGLVARRPALQEMSREVPQREGKRCMSEAQTYLQKGKNLEKE